MNTIREFASYFSKQHTTEEALKLEAQFAANKYSGSHQNPPIIEVVGRRSVVISCPHAVNHPRENRLKLADTFTGALGLQLAEFTGASLLVYARTTEEDPNFDKAGPYKTHILGLIARVQPSFVIDLHGLGRSQRPELVIGTSQGATLGHNLALRDLLVQIMNRNRFTNIATDIPGFYDASRSTTIAAHVWREVKIPSLQLEIHKNFRDPVEMPENYNRMLNSLAQFIETSVQISQ